MLYLSYLFMCMHVYFVFSLFSGLFSFVDFPSVLWYCWLGLLTCKNHLPYNLFCVGGDVKHCTIQSNLWHSQCKNLTLLNFGVILSKQWTDVILASNFPGFIYMIVLIHVIVTLQSVISYRDTVLAVWARLLLYSGILLLEYIMWVTYCEGRYYCIIEKKLQFITLLTATCIVSHIENSKNDKGYIT